MNFDLTWIGLNKKRLNMDLTSVYTRYVCMLIVHDNLNERGSSHLDTYSITTIRLTTLYIHHHCNIVIIKLVTVYAITMVDVSTFHLNIVSQDAVSLKIQCMLSHLNMKNWPMVQLDTIFRNKSTSLIIDEMVPRLLIKVTKFETILFCFN